VGRYKIFQNKTISRGALALSCRGEGREFEVTPLLEHTRSSFGCTLHIKYTLHISLHVLCMT